MRTPLRCCMMLVLWTGSVDVVTKAEETIAARPRLVRDIAYRDESDRACRLDLALPGGPSTDSRPAIFVIHGGGWIEGDKSSFSTEENRTPGNILDFAERGFVAATINYRLSTEAPFPAALADCQCAVRWLRAQAETYRIDVNRIGAFGNSAGGQLALLLALIENPVEANEPHPTHSSQVQAAASDSGPLDLELEFERGTLRSVVEKFMGGVPSDASRARYRRASPADYVTQSVAPLLLMYGESDEQVDVRSADRWVAALGDAGARQITYVRLAQVGHCPFTIARVGYLGAVVDQFFSTALTVQK